MLAKVFSDKCTICVQGAICGFREFRRWGSPSRFHVVDVGAVHEDLGGQFSEGESGVLPVSAELRSEGHAVILSPRAGWAEGVAVVRFACCRLTTG
jgi:hypothetical protein